MVPRAVVETRRDMPNRRPVVGIGIGPMLDRGGNPGSRVRGALGPVAALALSLLLVATGCAAGSSPRSPTAEATAPEARPAQADRPATGPASSATAPTQPAANSA